MIKFFRKIRQKLLTENKFSKYLLYAIGEIILVVIGILIALSINNRNEEKKIHIKQENYLVLIKREMSNNLKSLEKVQNRLIKSIESDRTILDLMSNDWKLDSISEIDLSNLIANVLSNSFAVNYENGALSELISSGSLKDIENDSIRGLLSSWDGKIYGLREKEKIVRESWTRGNIFFETHGTLRTIFDQTRASEYFGIENSSIAKSNKPLMKSTIFENIFLVHLGVSINLDNYVYLIFEKDLTSLISLIEEELETKKKK